jgi:hypothetical protein
VRESKRLTEQVEHLKRFRDEFTKLVDQQDAAANEFDERRNQRNPYTLTPLTVRQEEELEDELNQPVEEQRRTVAEAAGPAAAAQHESGVLFTQQATQMQMNPVGAWSEGAADSLMVSRRGVLDAVHQAIGTLQDRQRVAERRERSMAGRVARVIRFPYEVREAAGLEPNSAAGKIAFGGAIVVQVLLPILTLVLGAWAIRILGP